MFTPMYIVSFVLLTVMNFSEMYSCHLRLKSSTEDGVIMQPGGTHLLCVLFFLVFTSDFPLEHDSYFLLNKL